MYKASSKLILLTKTLAYYTRFSHDYTKMKKFTITFSDNNPCHSQKKKARTRLEYICHNLYNWMAFTTVNVILNIIRLTHLVYYSHNILWSSSDACLHTFFNHYTPRQDDNVIMPQCKGLFRVKKNRCFSEGKGQ